METLMKRIHNEDIKVEISKNPFSAYGTLSIDISKDTYCRGFIINIDMCRATGMSLEDAFMNKLDEFMKGYREFAKRRWK